MSLSTTFSGAPASASNVTVNLPVPPGAGGGTGSPALVVDAISLGIRISAAADQWEVQLREGATIVWRCLIGASTSVGVVVQNHFPFPNGSGPRVSSATPTLVLTRTAGAGTLTSYAGSILTHLG